METWRDIPEYEGLYEASTLGRIRTKAGKTTHTQRHGVRHWKQRVLKQKLCRNKKGRIDARVELWKNGAHHTFLVSRLVAMAWVDGYSPELTVNHRDGNPLNNRIENLEWLTFSANIKHGFESGLYFTQKPVRLLCGDTPNGGSKSKHRQKWRIHKQPTKARQAYYRRRRRRIHGGKIGER